MKVFYYFIEELRQASPLHDYRVFPAPSAVLCQTSVTCSASLLAANHRCLNHLLNSHFKISLDIS